MTGKRDMPGKVYLVGAGPGDPDLITVKGYELLTTCDALVYDSLAAPELIKACPAGIKVYAGKTSGGHAMTQAEINRLLVDLATRPGGPERIVRLKGGDPYVFGRGGEEALACAEAGVPFEVVPGVSAGIAAAAYAGVPVTHRGVARGVALLTGHSLSGGSEHLPWKQLARSGMTLVFYMGVKHLPVIAESLIEHGMAPGTPAMVVQEGTTPGQRCVRGELKDIAGLAMESGIRPPAITVVGGVVDLAASLDRQEPRPLAGRTVVFLRAETYHYPEVSRLRSLGARVVDISVIRCSPRFEEDQVAGFIQSLDSTAHVLMTGEAAVSMFLEAWSRLGREGQEPTLLVSSHRFGLKAEDQGWRVVAPSEPGKENLLKTIRRMLAKDSIIWVVRSSSADPGLVETIRSNGYDARGVALYDVLPVPIPRDVQELLESGRADALVFASPSAVRAAVKAAPGLNARDVLVAAVGEATSRELSRHGIECDVVPESPGMGALVEALEKAFKNLSTTSTTS